MDRNSQNRSAPSIQQRSVSRRIDEQLELIAPPRLAIFAGHLFKKFTKNITLYLLSPTLLDLRWFVKETTFKVWLKILASV
ncbi:hypothetical protein DFA_06216 [Cavenderia fasciculata]|uniref:Uncharacterized protein n=1 Tax=Cavenderia fasciculata TaxID=261658 RepID=F4PKF4_CACFS|nr:uncharacterized protein DFA_06216 [Cavenderia fasciculata]EGG24078.1 hypothetical protein DFA_06216 [Cavenderia fasciculata]|eukprot:XP_004361929.1 hypothetical protein DFA_06216 [Cavenderia fasciculata]